MSKRGAARGVAAAVAAVAMVFVSTAGIPASADTGWGKQPHANQVTAESSGPTLLHTNNLDSGWGR